MSKLKVGLKLPGNAFLSQFSVLICVLCVCVCFPGGGGAGPATEAQKVSPQWAVLPDIWPGCVHGRFGPGLHLCLPLLLHTSCKMWLNTMCRMCLSTVFMNTIMSFPLIKSLLHNDYCCYGLVSKCSSWCVDQDVLICVRMCADPGGEPVPLQGALWRLCVCPTAWASGAGGKCRHLLGRQLREDHCARASLWRQRPRWYNPRLPQSEDSHTHIWQREHS